MANPVTTDASFPVALWRKTHRKHRWTFEQIHRHPPPWTPCESVLWEADQPLPPE